MTTTEKWITVLPNAVITIGSINKLNEIIHNFANHLLVFYFTSPYCGACRSYDPIFEQTQHEWMAEGIVFLKIDALQLGEVAQQFHISGTPTTLFVFKQKVKKIQVGIIPPGSFRQMLKDLVKITST